LTDADPLAGDHCPIDPLGLKLSPEKTRVVSIDEGYDFLGFAIKRVREHHGRMVIHTYPSKRALQSVKTKVKQITKHTGPDQAPDQLLHRVNRVLRGWCNYFRHGVSSRTFAYLRHYAYWRVVGWLRRRHRKRNWGWLRRTYLTERWPAHDGGELFNPVALRTSRYRYRGAQIPLPWTTGYVALRRAPSPMSHPQMERRALFSQCDPTYAFRGLLGVEQGLLLLQGIFHA